MSSALHFSLVSQRKTCVSSSTTPSKIKRTSLSSFSLIVKTFETLDILILDQLNFNWQFEPPKLNITRLKRKKKWKMFHWLGEEVARAALMVPYNKQSKGWARGYTHWAWWLLIIYQRMDQLNMEEHFLFWTTAVVGESSFWSDLICPIIPDWTGRIGCPNNYFFEGGHSKKSITNQQLGCVSWQILEGHEEWNTR